MERKTAEIIAFRPILKYLGSIDGEPSGREKANWTREGRFICMLLSSYRYRGVPNLERRSTLRTRFYFIRWGYETGYNKPQSMPSHPSYPPTCNNYTCIIPIPLELIASWRLLTIPSLIGSGTS